MTKKHLSPSLFLKKHKAPVPTVDIIIELPLSSPPDLSSPRKRGSRTKSTIGIVLVERKNHPYGWALPGGFAEAGDSLEKNAIREAKEETSLSISGLKQLHTYSDPRRDPRMHTVSTIFVAKGRGRLKAASDAKKVMAVDPTRIKVKLAFDHARIIRDYLRSRKGL